MRNADTGDLNTEVSGPPDVHIGSSHVIHIVTNQMGKRRNKTLDIYSIYRSFL